MKKIYVLFALIAIVTASNAQKITEANLKGKWKLTILDMSGVFIDIDNEIVTVSEEAAKLYKWPKGEVDNPLKEQILKDLRDDYVSFGKDFTITYKIFDQHHEEIRQYIIREEGNKQILRFMEDEEGVILFKDGNLHYTIEKDGLSVAFIFKKL